MGLEARCQGRVMGHWQDGLARLEEKEIVFRGEVRLRAPLDLIEEVRAARGILSFRFGGEEMALRLGEQAEKWAQRIVHPPSRLYKLGVKPGLRVCVLGLDDAAFVAEMKARGATVSSGRVASGADLVFLRCRTRADLRRLPALARAIRPEGAVWVLWPKGGKDLREQDVRDAAAGPGLVDVKVVSFSDALSGLKLMVRRALRPPRAAARREERRRSVSAAAKRRIHSGASDSRKQSAKPKRPTKEG